MKTIGLMTAIPERLMKDLGEKVLSLPLKAHGKQKGFDYVVGVVPERQLSEAFLGQNSVERAAPHFGAQTARIGFLSDIEQNLRDVGFFHNVIDVYLRAIVAYRGVCVLLKAHIDCHRHQLETLRRKSPIGAEQSEQSQTVLSSRHADGDFCLRPRLKKIGLRRV